MNNVAIKLESEKELEILSNAGELIQMADRVVINSHEDNEKASDLVKFIKTCFKKAEDDRKGITDPLNAVIKNINARYKKITEPLESAEKKVKSAMLTYAQEQRRIAEQEEAARRAAAEVEALERAVKLEEENKLAEADIIVDRVIEQNSAPMVAAQSQPIRGNFGSTSSIKKSWAFEVTDIKALANANPLLVIENAVAIREQIRLGVREIAGVRIFEQETMAVR